MSDAYADLMRENPAGIIPWGAVWALPDACQSAAQSLARVKGINDPKIPRQNLYQKRHVRTLEGLQYLVDAWDTGTSSPTSRPSSSSSALRGFAFACVNAR